MTDRDLRARVVAAHRDPALTRAGDIMSAPPVTVGPDTPALGALVEMTRRRIHHLVAVDGAQLLGIVISDDLVGLPMFHPVLLAREIAAATSREGLARVGEHVTGLVKRLVDAGTPALDIGAIVAELNDRIVERVLALAEADVRAATGREPPTDYCWLAFGSEGRREQTLRTDQDNGLVYADPPDGEAAATAEWFARLAEQTIAGLVEVGVPPCPADAMASNPRWRQPASVWAAYFRGWMEHPTPDHVLAASMYFDLRPVAGTRPLADTLRGVLTEEAPRRRHFLSAMALDVASRAMPLTLLGNIAVRRSGPRAGTVDLKGAGSLQLVGAGRALALELAVTDTSTAARFRAAAAAGVYSAAEATEIVDVFEHLLRLRLSRQLECLAAGAPADNDVNPKRLARRDVVLLRDAFRTVTRVQAAVADRFRAELMA